MSKSTKVETDVLPRLLRDPGTGEEVIEFRQFDGKMPNSLDRRVVVGAFRADIMGGDNTVCQKNVGVLRLVNGMFPTDHSYYELRDLLWPISKESIF